MRQIGNSVAERPHKLPKEPEKRELEQQIREFARGNGISIAVARLMFARRAEEWPETNK
jgi:hypothetical protein